MEAPKGFNSLLMPGNPSTATVSPRRRKTQGNVHQEKRRYEAAFVAKLNDSEAKAAETQTWLKFSVKCGYLDVETGRELYAKYNQVLGMLVNPHQQSPSLAHKTLTLTPAPCTDAKLIL